MSIGLFQNIDPNNIVGALNSLVVAINVALSSISGSFSPTTDLSTNPSIRLNGSSSRSQAIREADWFNPKDFGAKNNSSATANSVLGITTLSGLTGYTVNGVAPYSWAATFPFGNLFNLGISSAVTTSTSTTTTLTFSTTAVANSSAPDQTGTNPDLYIPTTSSGIYQDMIVTSSGSCITNSTTLVEWYVPTTGEIRLSAPTAANCNGQTLTFKPRWFSNISVGMYVCAGIVACPNTSQVTAISSSAPWTVTISAASTSQSLTPISSTNFVGSQITFWSQWTSAQAQALTMDYLAIQAAEKAAEATSGGRVWLGYGTYYTNGPIIFPTGALSVSMTGDGRGEQGQTPQPAAITAIADLGPGQFAVSCGEPTEGITNGRGIYANGGTFCYGDWAQFTLTTPTPNVSCGSGANTCGYRPQINGLPIAMNGFQQGPRRYERMIQESGFNVGNQFQGDHTHFDEVDFSNNFINLRLNDPMANLYFDIDAVQLKAGGASYIGLSIAPAAVFQGIVNKAWIADEPYLVMGEAGNNNIFVDTIINMPNFEGAGCASIFDDDITLVGGGQARSVQNLTINGGEFQGGNTNYAPVGGCTWNAFIDIYGAYGLVIDDISNGSFLTSSGTAIAGATSIVRLTQVGSVISTAGQGVLLRGPGIGNVASILTAANQELVTGPGSGGSNFAYNGSWKQVAIENPGVWSGKIYNMSGATPLAIGNLIETNGNNNPFTVELSSSSSVSGANIPLGVTPFASGGSMNGKFIVVADKGNNLPFALSSTSGIVAGNCLTMSTGGNFALATNCLNANNPLALITNLGTPSFGRWLR